MLKADNPFTLEYGAIPNICISRTEEARLISNMFLGDHAVSHTVLISGVRGSGKTVLMSEVAASLDNKGWIVVNLNMATDLLSDFVQRLHEKAPRSVKNLIEKGISFSIGALFSVGTNGEAFEKDNVAKAKALLDAYKKKKIKVLITIDEVLCNQSMRVFASQFQILRREEYDTFLIMTGLHENINAIQHDPALTFLMRAPKINLSALDPIMIAQCYENTLKIDTREAMRLASCTKGYAYAFQALGMLYWDKEDHVRLEALFPEFETMLDQNAYRKIWEKLTDVEKTIVGNMSDKKIKVKDLMEVLDMSSNKFSVYRSRLIEKGVIRQAGRGYVELALPRFAALVTKYKAYDEVINEET